MKACDITITTVSGAKLRYQVEAENQEGDFLQTLINALNSGGAALATVDGNTLIINTAATACITIGSIYDSDAKNPPRSLDLI